MGLKIFLSLCIIITLLGVGSALNFEQNSNIDLKVPCQFNGSNCDSTAVCNASVAYPNGSLMIENQLLTNGGNGVPNISISDSSVLGTYIVSAVCTQSGISGGTVFEFEISRTGTQLSTGQGILYTIFLIAAIAIFGLMLYWAIRLPFRNQRDGEGEIISINDLKYLKIFLSAMSYVVLMFIFGILRSITYSFLILPGPDRFFELMYTIMLSFLWPLIIVSLLFALIIFITDRKLSKSIERYSPY